MRKLLIVLSGIALVLSTAGTPLLAQQKDDDPVEFHMFASQGFMKSTSGTNWPISGTGKGTFQFNEFGFNISRQITPKFRVGMQIFAQSRGDYASDKPTIDWAYGDYRIKDWFGTRVGKIKLPLGLYNESRDTDSLRTFVLLPQGMYNDRQRETTIAQTGIAIYGSKPVKSLGNFAYQLHVGSMQIDPDGGTAQNFQATIPIKTTSVDTKTVYVGNIEWNTPIKGLTLSTSGFAWELSINATATSLMTQLYKVPTGTSLQIPVTGLKRGYISAEYTRGNLVIASEYIRQHFKLALLGMTVSKQSDAYYFSGSYRFADKFEAGAYYDQVFSDRRDRDGLNYKRSGLYAPFNTWRKDFAATLRVDPVRHWTVKCEIHRINGTYEMFPQSPAYDQYRWLFAAKATFSF
jgi:hypothetical protein